VVAIDLATGDRSVISGADEKGVEQGTGGPLASASKISLDSANNRGFVLDRTSVIMVDLPSVNRTLLSGDSKGAGPKLVTPGSLAIDLQNNRLFVGDSTRGAVFLYRLIRVTG
jgi:hypothetical protein